MTKYLVLLLALAIPPVAATAETGSLRVDGQRLHGTMEKLKAFGGNEQGGSDRVAYSEANLQALLYLIGLMGEAGLSTHIDVAGNLIGRREGSDPEAGVILTGSHIDTVPNGGHYDGIVGVMGAIEVARTLHEAGIELEHGFEVAAWSNEERGKTGSRSLAESIDPAELDLPTYTEKTVGEGIRYLGGDPARIAENLRRPGDIAAFIELHVEQGGVMEQRDRQIGVVTGIVGIKRWKITVDGFANHAGTTPMNQRKDASLAAARIILAVNRIVSSEPGQQVGTVGIMKLEPGAANVVPGGAELHLEMRDLSMQKLDRLFAAIETEAKLIAGATGTTVTIEQYYETDSAVSDLLIMADISGAVESLGFSHMTIPSGAGHDAQSFKNLAPLGMIFVPSQRGISHSPAEYTAPADITRGANVLLHTIIALDRRLKQTPAPDETPPPAMHTVESTL